MLLCDTPDALEADRNPVHELRSLVTGTIRRLLSEQDRDRYSPTYGCFDRRYWAWKLVDFPEATFQRNVHSMAMLYTDPGSEFYRNPILFDSVVAGLRFAGTIQHRDGSFDQAFPNEHSFGATAFLLHSLLEAFRLVAAEVDCKTREEIEHALLRSAGFLSTHTEVHGYIANHRAAAVLSLLLTAEHFGDTRCRYTAEGLLQNLIEHQSPEGWFPEYDGADPGYQTLCLYYLAQVSQRLDTPALQVALNRAVTFVSHFAHPDGSFAGEYGSRRTAICYPGGLALLSRDFPLALALTRATCRAIATGHTVSLADVDMGNIAPVLSNYLCVLQTGVLEREERAPCLPWEESELRRDFPDAGLHVRGTDHYFAVLGASNGGVLRVFAKPGRRALWDDAGYVGQLADGTLVTTQMTRLENPCMVEDTRITLTSSFHEMPHALPTPFRFVLLRMANLTLMRSLWFRDLIKKLLVRLLVAPRQRCQMKLRRCVRFESHRVVVEDTISKSSTRKVKWLECGSRFVSVHMASAGYFEGSPHDRAANARVVGTQELNRTNRVSTRFVIDAHRSDGAAYGRHDQ